jgi:hypothetical protein
MTAPENPQFCAGSPAPAWEPSTQSFSFARADRMQELSKLHFQRLELGNARNRTDKSDRHKKRP